MKRQTCKQHSSREMICSGHQHVSQGRLRKWHPKYTEKSYEICHCIDHHTMRRVCVEVFVRAYYIPEYFVHIGVKSSTCYNIYQFGWFIQYKEQFSKSWVRSYLQQQNPSGYRSETSVWEVFVAIATFLAHWKNQKLENKKKIMIKNDTVKTRGRKRITQV